MPRKSPEAALQISVCDYLAAYERMGKLTFFAVPNDLFNRSGPSAMRRVARMKKMGLRPGAADLVVLLPNGRTLFWELKVKGGALSDNQKAWRDKVMGLGFDYVVIWSLDDAKAIIEAATKSVADAPARV